MRGPASLAAHFRKIWGLSSESIAILVLTPPPAGASSHGRSAPVFDQALLTRRWEVRGGPVRIRDRHLVLNICPSSSDFWWLLDATVPSRRFSGRIVSWRVSPCFACDEPPPQLPTDARTREFTESVSLQKPLCLLAHLVVGFGGVFPGRHMPRLQGDKVSSEGGSIAL